MITGCSRRINPRRGCDRLRGCSRDKNRCRVSVLPRPAWLGSRHPLPNTISRQKHWPINPNPSVRGRIRDAENRQAKCDQQNPEPQPKPALGREPARLGQHPLDHVAHAPRRNHPPHAHENDGVRPDSEYESPLRHVRLRRGQHVIALCVEHQLGQKDAGVIVIDEVAGFVVAMAFLPVKLWVVVIAFAIFRLLDILKPPPIDWIERRFKGGIAIVADDVVAGLLTNAVVHLLLLLVGSP